MEILPLGDSALVMRLFRDNRSRQDQVDAVHDACERLVAAELPGVEAVAPAYGTIALYYHAAKVPLTAEAETPFAALASQVRVVLNRRSKWRRKKVRLVKIPVCYEADFAPDLEEVARHAGLTPQEVIKRHSSAKYRVNCVGFAPGFPYLSGLPRELATPRRETPRTQVPAGSVAIGGAQTGIYPTISPGGWNVIGRTPARLFDIHGEPPALLAMGDAVRFFAITRADFEALMEKR